MSETVQLIIVSAVIVIAGILLFRSLRHPDCHKDDSCGDCPLKPNCKK